MPQQTKTEALEEIARKMRRDILDGTAPLDGVWWWTDDVKMQDRIAHVLLDYNDEAPSADGWVVYDASDTVEPFRFKFGWQASSHSTNSPPFNSRDEVLSWMEFIRTKSYFAIPLAAAHAIEAATKAGGK